MTESYDVSQPKQSPSIVPTVLLTGVGAGGGCLINKYAGSKKTHEDLIKEMNDKDAFNKNIADDAPNKDLWKELEKKNNAVNDAKKALEEASKGEADKTVQDALNTAQKNIDEWVAKENARLASNAPAAEAPKVTGFPEQLPELSKNNNTNTMKRKYEKLSKSYEAAKAKAGRKYNSEKTKITELQDAARNSFKMPASQTPQTIDELMADLDKEVVKTEIRQVVDPATNVKTFETVETDLYQEIKKKIMSANPPTFSKNVSNLTEEEAMNLPNGEFRKIKPSETVPQGFTKVTNTKGECFIYKTDAASEYLRTMNTNYKKNIENMADEVLNATKEYRIAKFKSSTGSINSDFTNMSKELNISEELFKKSGLIDSKGKFDIAKLDIQGGYQTQRAAMETLNTKLATIKAKEWTPNSSVTASWFTTKPNSREEAINMLTKEFKNAQGMSVEKLKARIKLSELYNKEVARRNALPEEIVKKMSFVTEAQGNYDSLIEDATKEQRAKIIKFFEENEIIGKDGKRITLNIKTETPTVAAEVKKVTAESAPEELRNALKEATEKFNSAQKTVNQELKTKAEQTLKEQEKLLKDTLENLAKKTKMPILGKAWALPVILGGVGLVGGLTSRASKRNS